MFEDTSSGTCYLQETYHGLQTANDAKVGTILKRAHRNERASSETFPVSSDRIWLMSRRHLDRYSG